MTHRSVTVARSSCNRLPSVTYPGRNSLPGATGPRANEGPYQETGLSWLRSRRAYSTYSLNADGRRREAQRDVTKLTVQNKDICTNIGHPQKKLIVEV